MDTYTCSRCQLVVPCSLRKTHENYICSRNTIKAQCGVCGAYLACDVIYQHERDHYENDDVDQYYPPRRSVQKTRDHCDKAYQQYVVLPVLRQEQVPNILNGKIYISDVAMKTTMLTKASHHATKYNLRCGKPRRVFLEFMRAV